jgi:hypothetical protein
LALNHQSLEFSKKEIRLKFRVNKTRNNEKAMHDLGAISKAQKNLIERGTSKYIALIVTVIIRTSELPIL